MNSQRLLSAFALLAALSVPSLAQDCGTWSRDTTPNPGSDTNLLLDVAAVNSGLALAVGNWSGDGLSRRPMVVRWDGSAWSSVALPETSHLGATPSIEGVGRTPSGDLWVVGYVRTTYPTDWMPLVMRWRGGGWESVATPTLRPQNTYPFAARGGFAYDAAGVGADDLWVVGAATGYGDASATSVGLALHFDGSGWEDVPVPVIGNRSHSLDRVSASAHDNVWAVGYWRNVGGAYQALIVRYDGSSWSRVPNPGEGPGGGDAQTVLALAPDDVWVSGSFNNGTANLIHWNGSTWDLPAGGLSGVITGFAAAAPDDIWASNGTTAVFYHYDGATWSPMPSPAIPGSSYVLRGWGLDSVGPCEVWSVGGYSDGVRQFTLAERLGIACRADFNGDGFVDFFDIDAFVSCFEGAECPPGRSADFSGDGFIDFFDFAAFVAAFEGGC